MSAIVRLPDPSSVSDIGLKNYINQLNKAIRDNQRTLDNQLQKGTLTGSVTLTTSAASTTISNLFIKASSLILMMPTTANAGVEAASGNLHYTVSNGSIVVSHTNSGTTGRTFSFTIFIN